MTFSFGEKRFHSSYNSYNKIDDIINDTKKTFNYTVCSSSKNEIDYLHLHMKLVVHPTQNHESKIIIPIKQLSRTKVNHEKMSFES